MLRDRVDAPAWAACKMHGHAQPPLKGGRCRDCGEKCKKLGDRLRQEKAEMRKRGVFV